MKQMRNKELLPFRVIKKLTKRITDLEKRCEELELILICMLEEKKQ